MSEKIRNSNFEILRIISMLFIVGYHFALYSGFPENNLIINFLLFGGKFGVNCYVLISGYFLIDSSCLNIRKLLSVWIKTQFYSTVIYAVACAAGEISFSYASFLAALFPITSQIWWFMTAYIILFLLHPFLNIILRNFERNTYLLYLLSFCALCAITSMTDISVFRCGSVLWFIFLYSVAAYLKIYGLPEKLGAIKSFALFILVYSVTMWLRLSFGLTFFFEMRSLPMFLSALFFFMTFCYMKPKSAKSVNFISATTFGVYLIHEHPLFRTPVWNGIFYNRILENSPWLAPYSLFAVVSVFVICALIDLAYIAVARLIFKALCRSEKFSRFISRLKINITLNRGGKERSGREHF